MQDPRVQAAIREAGEAALKDPKVQAQLMATCKEKFPEYAESASAKISQWGNDPEMQAKAKVYASQAGTMALSFMGDMGTRYVSLIEQGPDGLRVIAFIGSIGSFVWATWTVINIFGVLQPDHYLLSIYQAIFSATTMLFEAKPEWVMRVQFISRYQDMLIEKANFLAEVLGRGMFYIFQGTLWLVITNASLTNFLQLCIGWYLFIVGVLHTFMYFGIMPQHVSKKIRRMAGRGTVVDTSTQGGGGASSSGAGMGDFPQAAGTVNISPGGSGSASGNDARTVSLEMHPRGTEIA